MNQDAAVKKITQLIQKLPDAKKHEVIDFAEYLYDRELLNLDLTTQITEGLKEVQAGQFQPAEDILDEL